MTTPKNGITYADAGVDIDAGNALVDRIKPAAKRTNRSGVMSGLGGFGALFDLKAAGYTDPILVGATDGVGTKLRIAIDTGNVDGVGIDLVAMCVNDLVCQGAEPLFFLDYFATGKLDTETAARIIEGIAEGCVQSGCALIGGETAEMPGMYPPGDFDLAGFSVGAMERGSELPSGVVAGDVLLGLASSGVHSNGYSLVRKLVEMSGLGWDAECPFGDGTLGEALLTPTRLYVTQCLAAVRAGGVHALAHITGGGLTENLPRVLPDDLGADIDLDAWTVPPVFSWMAGVGGMAEAEMLKTFNCGIGMILSVDAARSEAVQQILRDAGETVTVLGSVGGDTGVRYSGKLIWTKRVAILISGGGSNMIRLCESMTGDHPARPCLVLSNTDKAGGLHKAQALGIKTTVVDHRPYGEDRAAFEAALMKPLLEARADIVCLAGFMRVLTEGFVQHWQDRMLNVHPSLLPKYRGLNTHARAIDAGEREHGCTVHLVTPELDEGPILGQAVVPVLPEDTAADLSARVLVQEHRLYPMALRRFASGIIEPFHLSADGQLVSQT